MEGDGPLSIGTKAVLDNLPYMLKFSNPGVIMINVQTLIRNRLSEDSEAKDETIAVAIRTEITEMAREISVMNLSRKNTVVIFYLYDYYRMLDSAELRGPSKQRDKISSVVRMLLRDTSYFPPGETRTTVGNMSFVMATYQVAGRPHERLYRVMENNTLDRRVLMVSHIPLDYLISTRVQDFALMKSFNAGYIPPARLSKKVFGEKYEALPFYQCTLKLFGDSVIVEPSIGLKEKRRVIEEATTGSWFHLTERAVEAEIDMLNIQYKEKK